MPLSKIVWAALWRRDRGRSGWGEGRVQVAVSGIQQTDGGGLDEVSGGDTGEESTELREIWEEAVTRLYPETFLAKIILVCSTT